MQGVITPNRQEACLLTSESSKKGKEEVRKVWRRRLHSGLQDPALGEICCPSKGIDARDRFRTKLWQKPFFFSTTSCLHWLLSSSWPLFLHTSHAHELSQIKDDPESSTVSLQDLVWTPQIFLSVSRTAFIISHFYFKCKVHVSPHPGVFAFSFHG